MSDRANAPPKPWVYVALPGQEIEYFQMQQEEPPPQKGGAPAVAASRAFTAF